jgi:hypothetical protein
MYILKDMRILIARKNKARGLSGCVAGSWRD